MKAGKEDNDWFIINLLMYYSVIRLRAKIEKEEGLGKSVKMLLGSRQNFFVN